MQQNYIFTYGTLRKGFNNPFSRNITENSAYFGSGWITGRLYEIDRFPGALITDEGYRIKGEIYLLKKPEETLPLLDKYEEYGTGFSEPNEYIRRQIPVLTEAGEPMSCWTYLYNWTIENCEEITAGDYLPFYLSRYGT